ncbi:hypothetical protein [Pantoea agglomerans]|uniref:hypothetical protein n=1 Tax=Enterobacter agglomerans TaxID=549 RepID=UPI0016544D8B|nr:hypothetical protein [Pantoea agglomerans]
MQRFHGALTDLRLDTPFTVQEFIELVEQTNSDCWSNYRMLRQAIREIAGHLSILDMEDTE